MATVARVCVFCGSSVGTHPAYKAAAQGFGRTLVRRGKGLVYGGGRVGLMGIIADAVLEAGGEVYGVLPESLAALEVGHEGLTALYLVPNMHARKAKMAELSDAFVAMPGGYGTLEELFEVVTWAQLGLHDKPIALLNVAGYYDGLLGCIDSAVAEGFIRPEQRRVLMSGSEPDALLDALERFEPVERKKWLRKPEET
ncbi:MAG TPA: TIGR00730 family Rossman fold protein [Planctomycetota bacterium]|nr:TIGR00730 family Rossman fold protein [Planctomycetota bacterium]